MARTKPKKYRCMICSHIYDPDEGDPVGGIAPGTAFENLSDNWLCPDCGASKADFEPIAETVLVAVAPGGHIVDPTQYDYARLRKGVRLYPLGPVY